MSVGLSGVATEVFEVALSLTICGDELGIIAGRVGELGLDLGELDAGILKSCVARHRFFEHRARGVIVKILGQIADV